MKINLEKNLVFADQPMPILAKNLSKDVKTRKAIKHLEQVQVDISKILPTVG